MKKSIIILIFLSMVINNHIWSQVSTSLTISDTRDSNELPSFYQNTIKADFKLRQVIEVPGDGLFSTTLTVAPWYSEDNSGDKNHQLNFNNGGVFYRNAYPLDSEWSSWQQIIMANTNGNVGIGIFNPDSKLAVNGTIHSKEVKVDMSGWPDFVFKKEYNLPTLEEVEKHIIEKGHLENIPNEKEVLKNGVNLGEMNVKLLQKIEELTLYVIELKKENKLLKDSQIKLGQKINKIFEK